MRRKISKLLEKAIGAHRPKHADKLNRALQEARDEEAKAQAEEERRRDFWYRRWR